MSGVMVEFVGGPVDGEQRAIYCDDPLSPPMHYMIPNVQLPARWWDTPSAPIPSITQLTYAREVSQRDDGPAWLYRWVKP